MHDNSNIHSPPTIAAMQRLMETGYYAFYLLTTPVNPRAKIKNTLFGV